MANLRRPLIDLASGFLVPYAAAAAFLLVFKSDLDAGKSIFSFVLPLLLLIFPFATLTDNPFGIAVIITLAGAFFAGFRFARPAYRPYAIGLIFIAWGFYGIYCTQWIAS